MIRFWNAFVKLTGWLPQLVCFRMRIRYENRKVQGCRIKGPAIIVSNHTAVYDFAAMLFVFFTRTLRYQIAELQFGQNFVGWLVRALGGIRVDRFSSNMNFMLESEQILRKGGVVGIFPEGRLPRKGEEKPLEFKPGAAYLSMATGVRVIPVYMCGKYFSKERIRVTVGTPIDPADYAQCAASEKECIERYAQAMREKIIQLEKMTHEQ